MPNEQIKYVLLDIEGTVSPIDFVKNVLFPYAAAHMEKFVSSHRQDPAVAEALLEVRKTVQAEEGRSIDDREGIAYLQKWIVQDRKHTGLKTIQGLIWEHGFKGGEFKSELYPDVVPALRRWRQNGLRLGIYSSGSIHAQKLFFAHTTSGDVTSLFSDFFDTTIGAKQETKSYTNITQKIGRTPGEVLFLSDVPAELDAAAKAGMETCQMLRPGTVTGDRHPMTPTLDEI